MKTTFLFPYKFKRISGVVFFLSLALFIAMSIDYEAFSKINPKLPVFAIAGNGESVYGNISDTALFHTHYFSFIYNEILDELLFFILIVSGIIYAFSKEKVEDEMMMKIRMDSLAWAMYFNYAVLLLCYLLFYGLPFFHVLVVSMFSNLLFFIIRFRWVVYKYNSEFDEK